MKTVTVTMMKRKTCLKTNHDEEENAPEDHEYQDYYHGSDEDHGDDNEEDT